MSKTERNTIGAQAMYHLRNDILAALVKAEALSDTDSNFILIDEAISRSKAITIDWQDSD